MSDNSQIQGRHFLVVDDVRFTRMTLARMLRQLSGTEVHEAQDGQAAIDWLSQPGHKVDCVITDVMMPNVSGLELLKAIRTGDTGAPRGLPVVLLTGQSELSAVGPALLLRLDEFVAKPVSQQAIRLSLEHIFDPELEARRERDLEAAEVYREVDLSPSFVEAVAEAGTGAEGEASLDSVLPGAVLSRDLLYENRRLLLPNGTRLTPAVLTRLRKLAELSEVSRALWIRA
jgi:CheY-like chemotaxis protein